MLISTLVMFVLVLGIKYFTSQEMRKLERRLHAVQEGFKSIKDDFKLAQKRQDETKAEETISEERIRAMKELIQDINVRLTTSDALADDRMQETRDALSLT